MGCQVPRSWFALVLLAVPTTIGVDPGVEKWLNPSLGLIGGAHKGGGAFPTSSVVVESIDGTVWVVRHP